MTTLMDQLPCQVSRDTDFFALNAWRMVKYFKISTAKEMHMIWMALGMTSTLFKINSSLSLLITNSWVGVDFLEQMNVPYVIPGLPTVEINGTVKEVEYTQYMQGIEKLVPQIKALYDNEQRANRIIQTMQQEVENMRVMRSFKPSWMLELYTNPLRVSTVLMKQKFLLENFLNFREL